MRLHGLVFILIGSAVAVASWILTQQGQKMTLFLFAGLAMLAFGVLRLLLDRNRAPTRSEHENSSRHTSNPHHVHTHSHRTGTCTVCGTRNHAQANFCGHCGARLA
jgi:membrane protein implicated in regulation of membrane protease activity